MLNPGPLVFHFKLKDFLRIASPAAATILLRYLLSPRLSQQTLLRGNIVSAMQPHVDDNVIDLFPSVCEIQL